MNQQQQHISTRKSFDFIGNSQVCLRKIKSSSLNSAGNAERIYLFIDICLRCHSFIQSIGHVDINECTIFPNRLIKSCTRWRANALQIARLVFHFQEPIERTTEKKEQVEDEQDENVQKIERVSRKSLR